MSLTAGVTRETMRLQPVKQIGLRKEVDPPQEHNQVEMCRCSQRHPKFVPYVFNKVTALVMRNVPETLLRNFYATKSQRRGFH